MSIRRWKSKQTFLKVSCERGSHFLAMSSRLPGLMFSFPQYLQSVSLFCYHLHYFFILRFVFLLLHGFPSTRFIRRTFNKTLKEIKVFDSQAEGMMKVCLLLFPTVFGLRRRYVHYVKAKTCSRLNGQFMFRSALLSLSHVT